MQLFIDCSHFVIESPGKEGISSVMMCKFDDFGMCYCNEFFDKERNNFGDSISLNKSGSSVVIGVPFSGSTVVFSK